MAAEVEIRSNFQLLCASGRQMNLWAYVATIQRTCSEVDSTTRSSVSGHVRTKACLSRDRSGSVGDGGREPFSEVDGGKAKVNVVLI